MNSRIFTGRLTHARRGRVAHAFAYPACVFAFDLDELDRLDARVAGFGHNRPRPFALHDRDYLTPGAGSIRTKLGHLLAAHGIDADGASIELITMPRTFGHAFNPVNFFVLRNGGDAPFCIVAEVSNTFGQRHLYVLDELEPDDRGGWRNAAPEPKVFHVSPFYDVRGAYRFRFGALGDRLDIGIDVERDGAHAFSARLTGRAHRLDGRGLLRAALVHAPTMLLTLPRIWWQAAQLAWRRGLRWHGVPAARAPGTIRRATLGPVARLLERRMLAALGRADRGRIEIRTPEGATHVLGAGEDPAVHLAIHDPAFYRRVALRGDVGFGEAFERGEWTSPDATALLEWLGRNRDAIEHRANPLDAVTRPWMRLRHALRANTRAGSRRNIRDHYDRGNAFFALFLDPDMTYSSARFAATDEPLERAQQRKLDLALERTALPCGGRLLEIGFGWGSFARHAARSRDARVHGLTLSASQLAWADAMNRARDLAGRIRLEYRDWRTMHGTFDAIVAIEMIEAVGHGHLPRFFAHCDRMLARGGRLVLQAITIREDRYDAYRKRPDWIQHHVFPGGHLPSVEGLRAAAERASSLRLIDIERFGLDYARTLRAWRERFTARRDEILGLGFGESFARRWEYYLRYCEAGFVLGEIDVAQIVLARPDELAPA